MWISTSHGKEKKKKQQGTPLLFIPTDDKR